MSASPDPQPALNHFLNQFAPSVGAKAVFGEPIVLPYATVVPVAKTVWGLGAGFGQGQGKEKIDGAAVAAGSGGGYGGGATAYPLGVFDIRPKRTRFVPTTGRTRHVLLGMLLGATLAHLLKRN